MDNQTKIIETILADLHPDDDEKYEIVGSDDKPLEDLIVEIPEPESEDPLIVDVEDPLIVEVSSSDSGSDSGSDSESETGSDSDPSGFIVGGGKPNEVVRNYIRDIIMNTQ